MVVTQWRPLRSGFLQPRVVAGETAWFYHDGHPTVGVHGVNATGVELRTGARFAGDKLSGSYGGPWIWATPIVRFSGHATKPAKRAWGTERFSTPERGSSMWDCPISTARFPLS